MLYFFSGMFYLKKYRALGAETVQDKAFNSKLFYFRTHANLLS